MRIRYRVTRDKERSDWKELELKSDSPMRTARTIDQELGGDWDLVEFDGNAKKGDCLLRRKDGSHDEIQWEPAYLITDLETRVQEAPVDVPDDLPGDAIDGEMRWVGPSLPELAAMEDPPEWAGVWAHYDGSWARLSVGDNDGGPA